MEEYFMIGLLAHLPQMIIYTYIDVKNRKSSFRKLCAIFKFFYKMPVNAIVGLYTFCMPLPVYKIPFIKETQSIWKYNFYPAGYVLIINIA